tara:strand:+ start:195 stop:2123 length:1929 start_codon:yes stop_codon:yes gene_type:complete
VIGNQPQAMSVIMTDVSEVRLDSAFILSPSLTLKTKSIYDDDGRVIRIQRYGNLYTPVNNFNLSRSLEGIDSDGITISVTNDEISVPDGYEINSVKISDFIMTSNGIEYGCNWYEAIVDVTGGIRDGYSVQSCATDFNNLDVTGFSSINVSSVNIDEYDDYLTLSFQIEVEIAPNTNDIYDFNFLTNETNYEYDSNGNTILVESIYYNYENGEVDALERQEVTFSSDNNILTYKKYYWDNDQESLYLTVDQERFYDESGYYIEGQLFIYYPDGSISFGSKYEFTRDSDGLLDYRTEYIWDNDSGFFLVVGEKEIARFENFNTDITLNFNGSTSLETLSPSSKNILTRDGFNTVSISYIWDTNTGMYFPSNKTYYNRTYFDGGESVETYESATSFWNSETDSFEYYGNEFKTNQTYDINGRLIYSEQSYYSANNQEFITDIAIENQYDDNGNRTFNKTSNYVNSDEVDYVPLPLGAWISSNQEDFSFDDNGFISQRLYSSGSYQNSEIEYVTAYFKDDYSTILDSETNLIRMGTPSLSEDGIDWQETEGSPFKSYYWYTQNSSLSTGDDNGSRTGLFPNPTDSVLFLNTNIPHKIEVYDLGGRKIIESIGVEIDISSLSNATYVVKIIDLQSDEFVSKKIIKE